MFQIQTCLSFLLAIFAISLAYKIEPIVEDGTPNSPKLVTSPFINIGKGLYYLETKNQANWYSANQRCHQLEAELISFETIEEWILINKYLRDKSIENRYWTSGNDWTKQNTHVWLSNGKAVNKNSTIWATGQPDNDQNERCDEFGFKKNPSDQRGLNDVKCHYQRPYICERPQSKTVSFVVW